MCVAELELKRSLYEQGVEDGSSLLLKEEKDKAEELKKKVRKKKLISFITKKVFF